MIPIRRTAIVLAATSALVLVLGAGPALGAKSCGRQVIDDWYDNGRVDKLYDLHCYEDAIDALPEDVVAYSSAKDDIERALALAVGKGQPAGDDDEPDTTPTDTTGGEDESETPPPPPDDTDDTSTTTTEPRDKDETPEALPDGTKTSNADSVPLPLIVLGALALLLLAAGGAGYLNRRLQARRIDGGGPPSDL